MQMVKDQTCLTELDGKERFNLTIKLELIGLELEIHVIPGVAQNTIAILSSLILGAVKSCQKFKAKS